MNSFGVHGVTRLSEDNYLIVGRCYNGAIAIGTVFCCVHQMDDDGHVLVINAVSLEVSSIRAHGFNHERIESGLTAELKVSGTGGARVVLFGVLADDCNVTLIR